MNVGPLGNAEEYGELELNSDQKRNTTALGNILTTREVKFKLHRLASIVPLYRNMKTITKSHEHQ
jgi:hypothetical protein